MTFIKILSKDAGAKTFANRIKQQDLINLQVQVDIGNCSKVPAVIQEPNSITGNVVWMDNNFYIPLIVTEFNFVINNAIYVWTWNVGTSQWVQTIFTTFSYSPNPGLITEISDGVTHNGTHFIVPENIIEFTFKDNGVSFNATFNNNIWTIELALSAFDVLMQDGNTHARYKADEANISYVNGTTENEVQQWNDISGNNRHLVIGAGTAPTFNNGEVRFNQRGTTTESLRNINVTLSQPYTMYYVLKCPSSLWTSGRAISRFLNGTSVGIDQRANHFRITSGINVDTVPRFVDKYDIIMVVGNGDQSIYKVENQNYVTFNPGTTGISALVLGGTYSSTGNAGSSFKEFILRQGADSEESRNIIINHLRNLYAENLVAYTPNPGPITEISNGVSHTGTNFSVGINITTFTFKDNGVNKIATLDGTWSFTNA